MNEYKEKDVLRAIRKTFPNEEFETIKDILFEYGKEAHEGGSPRVYLAILKLSKGNVDELLKYVELAKTDFRDVLLNAEYVQEGDWKSLREIENPYGDLL